MKNSNVALSRAVLVNTNSLEAYLNQIKTIPVLSAEEELQLATSFYQHKNLEAARKLVISNLRFVVYIAKGYANYGLPMSDLIQEGSVGLMKAVKRFNPGMKVRLISFAVHWIKAEIQEFILRNWRIVRVATTKAKRKLFFNLRRIKKRLGWNTQEEVLEVARTLNVDPKDVRKMEVHLNSQDVSIHSNSGEYNPSEDGETSVPALSFSDSRYDPAALIEERNRKAWEEKSLRKALAVLDKRSKHIIIARWLNASKQKLEPLAGFHRLSIERVRQLEKKALQTLRKILESNNVSEEIFQ